MANDNLIQKVINELNYEIIQLKYKNETNVTMRIDSIIEFLEGVKDDVIDAQENQKFDLHRTATNCVITILDKDNNAITDGSNKLKYGDVIKISVLADTGYTNATISVNGLPFTSGNTMVVKTDLTIVGNATAETYFLERTATNCTITVLDSDNEPITDGANKLTYGDVITISAVASEGYELTTFTVNGTDYISGSSTTVRGNFTIIGTATESLNASFEVADVLANGDKIHFDTTANMVSDFYSQLTYTPSGSGDYIVLLQSQTYSHLYIQAISNNGEYFLMGYVGGSMIPIHATTATTLSGVTFAGGWENVDANGDITLSGMSEGETLITVASGDWNGTIISKG